MRRIQAALFALIIFLLIPLQSFGAADDVSRLYTFSPGNIISSSEMNAEFNQLITTLNNKAGRGVANTFTGANIFSGLNTFSNITTFSEATTGLKTDKVSEYTSTNGVSVDGTLLKDGYIRPVLGSDPTTVEGNIWTNSVDHLLKFYDGTATRTVATDGGVNAQTGTTYTVVAADRDKLVTLSNASAVAVTLPQAGGTGFTANYKTTFVNLGAGTVTITPTTSTIDGAASLTLTQNQGVEVFSNGTNYFTNRGRAATSVLTESYTSADQTITSGGSLTLAHGLSGVPKILSYRLICQTAEGGYSIGDEVEISAAQPSAAGALMWGHIAKLDATNITIRYGSRSSVYAIPKNSATTGDVFEITNANWKLRVKAFN